MARILGVLGGMGPAATVDFLTKLQAATPATRDADHVRVVMDLNPRVIDRHGDPDGAIAELAEMSVTLRTAGAQVLAMPCNTAHIAAGAIREASGLPFIDMIDEAVAAARATGARDVGVIATPGGTALYVERLAAAGLTPVRLTPEAQDQAMALIGRIKAGDVGPEVRAGMEGLAAGLAAAGAGAIIAGCTEVPLALAPDGQAAPLIDATDALAQACVRACAGQP